MLVVVGFAVAVLWSMWQLQPQRMERRGPSAWIGMRSDKTVASAGAWAAAHRAAWPMARTGCVLALVVLAVAAVAIVVDPGMTQWEIGSLGMGGATTVMLITFLIAFRKAERAAGEATNTSA